MGQDRVGQLARGDEPALVERGLVEREQAIGQAGVVLEDAVGRRPTVLPASVAGSRLVGGDDRAGG